MDARVLIKCSTSKCNKELLSFLHQNIDTIKKRFSLKVIIVYDDLIPKLGDKIKKLPVLIINGKVVTGNDAITQYLVSPSGKSNGKGNLPKDMGQSDLEDYWNNEMHSGIDDDTNEDDLMEEVKNRALEQSIHHRENNSKQKKRKEKVVTSSRQDNIRLDKVNEDKISDMVDGDPMMQKFWENQENTPGFG